MWNHEEWRANLRREFAEQHAAEQHRSESCAVPDEAKEARGAEKALRWVIARMDEADRLGPGVGV